MRLANPIVLKELLQAARRRWTFALRAGLPIAAMLLLAPKLIEVLERSGQDWRAIADLGKSVFRSTAWLELIAFSLVAFAFCSETLHEEWRRKTMDVLCASPLSVAQVVYGKFLAVLGKLGMLALALLPVMGLWFHLGRMPREIVLGTFAIIVGSVFLWGSFALLQAASYRPGRGYGVSMLSLVLPYFLILSLLDGYVWVGHPLLEAAIGPRALFILLYRMPPGGLTPGGFALLSLGIHLGLSGLALAISPKIFARSFAQHVGGAQRKESALRRLKRFLRGRRPPMRPWQNPFYWVEKGPFSRVASRSVWTAYIITAIISLAGGLTSDDGFEFLGDDEFWILVAIEGLLVLAVSAALYGTSIFSREKERLRAPALLLTGASSWQVMRAKILAVYKAQWLSMVVVGIVLFIASKAIGGRRFSDDELLGVAVLWQAWLFGPLLGIVVGMAFSLAARSVTRAALGFLSSILWGIGLGFCIGISLEVFGFYDPEALVIPVLIANAVFIAFNRKWGPLRLGFLLALNFYFLIFSLIACAMATDGDMFSMTVVGCGIGYLAIVVWAAMGLRFFDAGLAGRPVSLRTERQAW